MKKVFFIALMSLVLFSGCSLLVGADGEDGADSAQPNVWVVNSAWKIVKEYAVASRALESLDAVEAEVEAYNDTTTDDQLTIITDEEDLDIELAPEATLTIIFTDTNEVHATSTVIRADLESEREIFRKEVKTLKFNSGRETALYVDNDAPSYTPPYVEPVDTRTDYEKYSIYVLAPDGSILFEEHCSETVRDDEDVSSDEEYFTVRLRSLKLGLSNDFPAVSYIISGYIYTPPTPETPAEDPVK